MRVCLKGGVYTSIDENGIMSKATTWMCIDDSSSNVFTKWLAFQADVETWAGVVGGSYKRPKQDSGATTCSAFDLDTTFLVSSINTVCIDKTHYEVSFTHTQNTNVMKLIGNVSVQINNNNEVTKSVTYLLTVATDSPTAIDAHLIQSGTVVSWAGSAFLMESSSYSAQSSRSYTITFSAKDMAVLQIGLPSLSVDGFGQRIKSATYRYSVTAYNAWSQPAIGADVSTYVGEGVGSGYILNNIKADPDGVLGYVVKIEARHVSKRLVKVDRQVSNPKRNGLTKELTTETNITAVYQSDGTNITEFEEMVGQEALALDAPGTTINSVNTTQSALGEYEITLNSKDDDSSVNNTTYNNSSNALAKEVVVQINFTHFVLLPIHLGLAKGISDIEWNSINNPPTSTNLTKSSSTTLIELDASSTAPNKLTQAAINALKIGDKCKDAIVRARWDADNKLIDESKYKTTPYAGNVMALLLERYNYAQPGTTSGMTTINNVAFRAWEAAKDCPLFPLASYRTAYPKYTVSDSPKSAGLDKSMPVSWIGRKIPMAECSITKNYKGEVTTVLPKRAGSFFTDAVDEVNIPEVFTSFKQTNLQVSEIKDSTGDIWTQVTQTLAGLMGWYWNFNYDDPPTGI